MKTFQEFITEKNKELIFKTYSDAIQYALNLAKKKGYTYDEDEYFRIVATGSKKPSVGKTTRISLPLYKKRGKEKGVMNINVYGLTNGKYELTGYVGKEY